MTKLVLDHNHRYGFTKWPMSRHRYLCDGSHKGNLKTLWYWGWSKVYIPESQMCFVCVSVFLFVQRSRGAEVCIILFYKLQLPGEFCVCNIYTDFVFYCLCQKKLGKGFTTPRLGRSMSSCPCHTQQCSDPAAAFLIHTALVSVKNPLLVFLKESQSRDSQLQDQEQAYLHAFVIHNVSVLWTWDGLLSNSPFL